MANNGNIASHIIIGVSNDRKNFKSVQNPKLTDDNLQDFCKQAITPPPKVKLYRYKYSSANAPYRDKEFIFIQVGPQARQAFRLSQDFIDYERHICYIRNEVWIRRGATSDLATPEEIARMVAGDSPFTDDDEIENVTYSRLQKDEQQKAVLKDLAIIANEVGCHLIQPENSSESARLLLPIENGSFVLRVAINSSYRYKLGLLREFYEKWQYEHGLLAISLGSVSEGSLPFNLKIKAKEKWGWFAHFTDEVLWKTHEYWSNLNVPISLDRDVGKINIIAISSAKDTKQLRRRITAAVDDLRQEASFQSAIQETWQATNKNLTKWLKEGWMQYEYEWSSFEKEGYRLIEKFSRSHWSYVRIAGSKAEEAARTILELSKR